MKRTSALLALTLTLGFGGVVVVSAQPAPKQAIPDSALEQAKVKCRELGFKAGTEKFGSCVMTLYEKPVASSAEKPSAVASPATPLPTTDPWVAIKELFARKDYAAVIPLLRPLVTKNDPNAQVALGGLYAVGLGLAQDYKEAARLWGLAAAQGNAEAQRFLGLMYADGTGVAQDYREAARLFRLAAAQANASAQFNLGVMYSFGRGVTQDDKEAVRLYGLAAAQGYAAGQNSLGWMYAEGKSVTQDYKEAVRLYRLAAAQGNVDAQNNLGTMYAQGHGVAQDYVRAYTWYYLGAISGDSKNASTNRDTAATQMTPAQIAQAQEMARKCQASNFKHCD